MSQENKNALPNLKVIADTARQMLEKMNNGKEYPSFYVANRLEKAAEKNSTDHLIGNMRDIVVKIASKQEFITQKEIGALFDRMAGLGSTQSFRSELGDLLPADRQFAEKKASSSNIRARDENPLYPIYEDSDLSSAFGKIFSVDSNSSFSTFNNRKDKSVEKVALAALNSVGYAPVSLKVTKRNDHFALCTALYATRDYDKVAVNIPIQITESSISSPEGFIAEGKLVPLTKENLFLHMKNEEHMKKASRQASALLSRNDMVEPVKTDKVRVPKELNDYADLENALIAAASKFDRNQVNTAISVVETELKSLGAVSPSIKVASSNEKELIFDASIPTRYGRKSIEIPVEFHNGRPSLPSKFYSIASDNSRNQFRLNQKGWQDFVNKVEASGYSSEYSNVISRDNEAYSHMSLNQLMDYVLKSVSKQKYSIANDALKTIQAKFGDDQFKIALDKYSKMLGHIGSGEDSKRDKFIQAAVERGDLIKRANYAELYCPKLGVPLSKVAFDDTGRVIPRHRSIQGEHKVEDIATTTGNGSIVIK